MRDNPCVQNKHQILLSWDCKVYQHCWHHRVKFCSELFFFAPTVQLCPLQFLQSHASSLSCSYPNCILRFKHCFSFRLSFYRPYKPSGCIQLPPFPTNSPIGTLLVVILMPSLTSSEYVCYPTVVDGTPMCPVEIRFSHERKNNRNT